MTRDTTERSLQVYLALFPGNRDESRAPRVATCAVVEMRASFYVFSSIHYIPAPREGHGEPSDLHGGLSYPYLKRGHRSVQ